MNHKRNFKLENKLTSDLNRSVDRFIRDPLWEGGLARNVCHLVRRKIGGVVVFNARDQLKRFSEPVGNKIKSIVIE